MFPENPLIPLFLRGLSIQRWNTFPRLQNITTLDHLGFVAHIGILLIDMLEEKEWKKYNRWLFLKKVLFSWLFTFIYSDINSEVKERIQEKNPSIYSLLEENIEKNITDMDMDEDIKQDIISTKKTTPEDEILTFSKLWASYYEIYHNSLVYEDAYDRILKNIILKSEKKEFALFLTYLPLEPKKEISKVKYLLVIHRLASSFRWNRLVRRYPVSVLSHTVLITFFTYLLACEEKVDENTMSDMFLTALFHDIPESITWDIITPTKKSVNGLESIIESIEEDMVHEHLLSFIREFSFHEVYTRKMLKPWKELNWKIVKKADTISAYYEAALESPYSEDFQKTQDTLEKIIKQVS